MPSETLKHCKNAVEKVRPPCTRHAPRRSTMRPPEALLGYVAKPMFYGPVTFTTTTKANQTATNKEVELGQKSCRPKVPRIFKIFVPNFAPNFAPNFPRIFQGFFVLCFVGNGDQKKFTKNPRHFSMQNSQANTKKVFTKYFWRAGKVRLSAELAETTETAKKSHGLPPPPPRKGLGPENPINGIH